MGKIVYDYDNSKLIRIFNFKNDVHNFISEEKLIKLLEKENLKNYFNIKNTINIDILELKILYIVANSNVLLNTVYNIEKILTNFNLINYYAVLKLSSKILDYGLIDNIKLLFHVLEKFEKENKINLNNEILEDIFYSLLELIGENDCVSTDSILKTFNEYNIKIFKIVLEIIKEKNDILKILENTEYYFNLLKERLCKNDD